MSVRGGFAARVVREPEEPRRAGRGAVALDNASSSAVISALKCAFAMSLPRLYASRFVILERAAWVEQIL